ncbi:hypothetical protein ES319_A09G047900v1 [Gossypium barbadense]|uniref:Uncharacterized protein n=1 Tax=Gossypium barbadense TaxID=3634 RepID=A0A5J5UAU2_GOSBA|nr:hypothetical protein ES319_A09G047900v1 [Gossypium barbadense]
MDTLNRKTSFYLQISPKFPPLKPLIFSPKISILQNTPNLTPLFPFSIKKLSNSSVSKLLLKVPTITLAPLYLDGAMGITRVKKIKGKGS